MTELLPNHSVVTVLSWGGGARPRTVCGFQMSHHGRAGVWAQAGWLVQSCYTLPLCSVGRSPETELKYSCYCPFETRDPAAPKGEHDL